MVSRGNMDMTIEHQNDVNEVKKEPLQFLEVPTEPTKPKRCVDGRPDPNSKLGPQMLGGSILPLFLHALDIRQPFTEQLIANGSGILRQNGFGIGAHRGSHAHGEASDCGFADRLGDILSTADTRRNDIRERLLPFYQLYADVLGSIAVLDQAFEILRQYSRGFIEISGDNVVELIAEQGGDTESVQDNHGEEVAFVNLKPNTTFNTNEANSKGRQAFNLDLWAVLQEAKAFGIDEKFAAAASLILYQATEIVLVENKGKPALKVIVNN